MHRPVIAVLLLGLLGGTVRADDWPQFRGPNCSGIASGSKAMPVEFSETKNVLWSVELGDGVGSPIIADGKVYISAVGDPGHVALFAFDADDGRFRWGKQWETGDVADVHKTNSQASTTPASDGKRVYFYYSTVGLVALDCDNGKVRWHRTMPEPYFVFKWGPAMSPIVYRDKVIFCQDDDLYPSIQAFDSKTGELVWKDDRGDMAVNYSHPIVCTSPRGDELVVGGTGILVGYDPANGKRLWHSRTLLRNIKTTPVSFNGIVYVAQQSGGIANQWLATADGAESEGGNNDGKLTKAEMQAFVGKRTIPEAFFKRTFDKGDVNKDGVLEGVELDKAFLSADNFAGARFDAKDAGDQAIHAVRGGGRGDVTKTHVLWKHEPEHIDHIVSPLVVDGRMLLVKGGGIATCFDIKTGKTLWGPKRIDNASDYFASPIYADGKIYVAGENGIIVVLKSSAKLEILAKNDIGDSVVGTPAIADGRLYVRTRSKLVCVGLK